MTLTGGATVVTSLGLAWLNRELLGEHGPEWAVRLPAALRAVNLAAPPAVLALALVRRPGWRTVAEVLSLLLVGAQVQALWLLSGRAVVPETWWTSLAALAWLLMLAREDSPGRGLQALLALFVLGHCAWPDEQVRRGGHALVGGCALLAGLLISWLGPEEKD